MNTTERPAGRFRVAVNIGLGVVFGAVLVVMAGQYSREGRDWVFDLGIGVIVCLVALLRERHKAWALVIGMAVSGIAGLAARIEHLPREPGAATTLALLVLAGSAIRTLPLRLAPVVTAAGMAVTAVDWLPVQSLSKGAHGPFLLLGVLVWCAALGVGLGLRLSDYGHGIATETVRRDERLALARELHDVVAHHITGIVLQVQAARIVARRHPETQDDMLAGIEQAGTDALAATRRVVGLLRDADDAATTSPGPEQLTELVRRFDEYGHGPTVHLHLPAENAAWPLEVTTTVYRIVQESLTNIAHHAAHARSATVCVAQDQEAVTVEITDDAPPAPRMHPYRAGFGLVGMRERVEALGGTLRAGPRPDSGWSVRATLPVPAGDRR